MAERAHVLVVDDNALGRELAHDVLEDAGYSVLEAASAAEAVAALDASAPAAVLLDWHLKGTTGATVLRAVRDTPAHYNVRVLVVTADVRPELRVAALAAGADGVLTRPYRAASLIASLAALLGPRADEED